jgi:hypothetical protein
MVNESQIEDTRFWKKWSAAGAVGNIDDAYRRKYPQWDSFNGFLNDISAGDLYLEITARLMIEEYGLPVELLEAALKKGRPKSPRSSIDCLDDLKKGIFAKFKPYELPDFEKKFPLMPEEDSPFRLEDNFMKPYKFPLMPLEAAPGEPTPQHYVVSDRLTGKIAGVVDKLPEGAQPSTDKSAGEYFLSLYGLDYSPISEQRAKEIRVDMGRSNIADQIRREMRQRDDRLERGDEVKRFIKRTEKAKDYE